MQNGVKLDLWRAMTDNDFMYEQEASPDNGLGWVPSDLNRLQHRINRVYIEGECFIVETYVAPAITNRKFMVTYRWTAAKSSLKMNVKVEPKGDWSKISSPRLGVRFGLPKDMTRVEWYGLGPGEANPDTRSAARLGQWDTPIDDMQTPYVIPQENGRRADALDPVYFGAASTPA